MSELLRVLIIEDSQDDAELLVCHLERSGYDVIYERVDTPDAMNIALEQQWHIVLADYSLPKFSATTALNLLQEKGIDLPFIVVSGCISDELAVAAMKAGAHDYLMKGSLARLAPAIRRELQEAAFRREQQRIHSELRDSEDRWQLALYGANDGIWDWNIKTNAVFFSARWKEMLGYAEDELNNHFDEWLRRVHPDDLLSANQAIQDHLAKKTQFFRTEHRLLCKDGSYKWILSRGQALWDEAGNAIRMVGSHTDITSTKQMEETLRQQAESLAEANRLKDEFLAVVSHELRTPLNPILGWAQILRNRRQLDEAATLRALETIERNAKIQKQLVEDLLDVSQVIQGKLNLKVTPINLVSVIELAMETVKTAANAKKISLDLLLERSLQEGEMGRVSDGESVRWGEVTYTLSPLMVLGDADRLQQVVWNLLSNAIKFTPEEGRVEIRLERVEQRRGGEKIILPLSPSSPLPLSPSQNYVQITVSDNGIGIKPEFLSYVFDRFRQQNSSTTRSHGGLGLGLAIVRHLVELHGGTVQVDSLGEGKGTTFIVQLPLLQDGGRKVQDESTYLSPLTGLQVLVVDDDPDNRELLVFTLTECGANAIAAASAQEALAAFKRHKLDAIVSDLGMPEEDGYALIRQVRMLEMEQSSLSIPAVAVSGYVRDLDRDRALDAGFQLHLSKPIDPSELVVALAQLSKGKGM